MTTRRGMVLDRLYSDTDLFAEIRFRPGLNVILGRYSADRDGTGINGIGKSSVVRMIDYLLLSTTAERLFAGNRYDFLSKERHKATLEFSANGELVSIRRGFGANAPIELRLGIGSFEEITKVDLKRVLTNKVFPIDDPRSAIAGNRFRTLMNFFLKDDLTHHVRADPTQWAHQNVKRLESARYNLFLLGLPTDGITRLQYEVDKYNLLESNLKAVEKHVERQAKRPLAEVRNQLNTMQLRVAELEKALDDFEFQGAYKAYEDRIEELSAEIRDELSLYQANDRRLNKLEEAMTFDPETDLESVQRIYNELKAGFGDAVVHALGEVVAFKRELTENRNKYLLAKHRELQELLSANMDRISALERDRGRLLRMLDQAGALDTVRNVYEEMMREKAQLDSAGEMLDEAQGIRKNMSEVNVQISEARRDIASELTDAKEIHGELQRRFMDVVSNAIYLGEDTRGAFFGIVIDPGGRRNEVPFKMTIAVPKADALGQSRLKIIAYDLMVFLNNVDRHRRMPWVLVHDGVFHGIEARTKVNVLNFISSRLQGMMPAQYVVTFNEDELPEERLSLLRFELDDVVVAHFEDRPDRMFFQRLFA